MGRAQADRGVAVFEPREHDCHQRLFGVVVKISNNVDSSGQVPFRLDHRIPREITVGVAVDDGDGYTIVRERNLVHEDKYTN